MIQRELNRIYLLSAHLRRSQKSTPGFGGAQEGGDILEMFLFLKVTFGQMVPRAFQEKLQQQFETLGANQVKSTPAP